MQIDDKEYLSRPLLENVNFDITQDWVIVHSDHTSYSNIQRAKPLNKDYMLDLYKRVVSEAKSQGVTVSRKNGYKKFIEDNWSDYKEEYRKYNLIFDKVIEDFREVQKRGLHSGTTDDIVLSKALKTRNDYMTLYYRTTLSSKMHDIKNQLESQLNGLINSHRSGYMYTKVVL